MDQILNVTSGAVSTLTIPQNKTRALIQVQGGPIRWRVGTTNPTTTTGNQAAAGETIRVSGADMASFKAIAESTATLVVTYANVETDGEEVALRITDNPVTISAGQSLSTAVNLAGLTVVRISIPAGWTAANLTVQTSRDNITYQDLYTQDGSPYVIAAGASRNINLNPADLLGVRWVRLRSSTAAGAVITAVNQVSEVALNIVAANI